MKRKLFIIACLSLALIAVYRETVVSAQQNIDFNRDIKPILNANCVSCHGAKKAAGQLRLDNKPAAMRGGFSGAVIVPNDSKGSILLSRIIGGDGQAQMPMGGDPLTAAQIELIKKWIDGGAVWPEDSSLATHDSSLTSDHWAYKKITKPVVPAVKNSAWIRNPVDNFILARLEKEGMKPAPEAAKETLLRRVSFDLIGLPPSVKEIDAFLADNSPNAYEKVVDRLLSSPHYGERWARPWLDLARYADSNGYEKDNLRVMWKYRDWVINALNNDLPFDQFTIQQLAGDMLPNPTNEQLIATGFHRNTLINQEGGIDPEEARFEILVDRVNTTSTVWLGSTMGCAQCHNHKYDPISQKDFYRMYAFYNSSQWEYGFQGEGMDDTTRWVKEPILDLPSPEQDAKRKKLDEEISAIKDKLKTSTPTLEAAQRLWERAMVDESKRWEPLKPVAVKSTNGTSLNVQADDSVLASGANPETDTYIISANTEVKNISALRLEVMTDPSLPQNGPGRDPYGNFFVTGIEVETASSNGKNTQLVSFTSAKVDTQTSKIETKQFFTKAGDNQPVDKPIGWQVNVTSDTKRVNRNAVFIAEKPFSGKNLTIKIKHSAGSVGQGIGRFRLSMMNGKEPEKITIVSATLKPVLLMPVSERTPKQIKDLGTLFRNVAPELKADRERLTMLQKELRDLGIVTALVMGEKPGSEKPSAALRNRGSFLSPGEKVFADVPSFLPKMGNDVPVNRYGLAKWLVSEENPLTARVAVNRFWEQFFGRGIVLTSEDFGTQGEAPSHPELLDWLSTEFMNADFGVRIAESKTASPNENNSQKFKPWSMKNLHRLIVTSSTYRQASGLSPQSEIQTPHSSDDPYNRLLARGPRFRVEAEMVRDLGLAASGLLSRKIGGKSVFPVQPDGIWKSPYSSEKWTTSNGEDRYRRSLYTFIRRTAPFPQMVTFDGTSRESCTVRRVRTNTPLQALTMLNDEGAMENARALAQLMMKQGGGKIEDRLKYGFRACITRMPEAAEIERLKKLYEQQIANFKADPESAKKITKAAKSNEYAALTMIANVLLNLDETVTKE